MIGTACPISLIKTFSTPNIKPKLIENAASKAEIGISQKMTIENWCPSRRKTKIMDRKRKTLFIKLDPKIIVGRASSEIGAFLMRLLLSINTFADRPIISANRLQANKPDIM